MRVYRRTTDELQYSGEFALADIGPTRMHGTDLEKWEGYLDIRLHLIEQVIRDPEERQKYVQIAKVAYHRSVLNRAVSLRDKVVTREAYGNLKRDHALTISDTIEYCAMFCPCVVFPLRCIRKLTRVLKKGNAGRRATHEHHTNS